METKIDLSWIIILTVGIVLTGGLLVPILNATTETIGTETANENAGAFFSDEPATIKCTSDGDWLVNGEAVTGHTDGYLLSDAGIVHLSIGNGSSGFFVLSDGTNGTLRNIIVSEHKFSYATTSDTETYIDVPCEYVYYSANEGDYALFTSSFNADNGDNVIAFNKGSSGYLCAQLNKSEVNFFHVSGALTQATIASDATITPQDGYSEWSSADWTLSYGENSTLTRSVVVAPATYTIRTEEQNSAVGLMYVIPIIVIIALVAVAANRVRNE